MAEPRKHHQILLQVVDRKPMPQPYPWVSYRSRDELRAAVVLATRVYWSAARRADVTLAGAPPASPSRGAETTAPPAAG
ncbi:hypothetical protein AB0N07_52240, partial [Streptomyces sp. NPDC051172]|uniref:hypothetical protein n=1 Tax=Streptomyces sp. NPDC051172 TaxID=3155796 RepID=UPI00341B2E0D